MEIDLCAVTILSVEIPNYGRLVLLFHLDTSSPCRSPTIVPKLLPFFKNSKQVPQFFLVLLALRIKNSYGNKSRLYIILIAELGPVVVSKKL